MIETSSLDPWYSCASKTSAKSAAASITIPLQDDVERRRRKKKVGEYVRASNWVYKLLDVFPFLPPFSVDFPARVITSPLVTCGLDIHVGESEDLVSFSLYLEAKHDAVIPTPIVVSFKIRTMESVPPP